MPATIEIPILPHRLYRYRTLQPREPDMTPKAVLDRELASIFDAYLWCSDYTRMNDPMEGYYRASTRLERSPRYVAAAQELLLRKQNVGLASFSDGRGNELMWAHYAGNYSGICVAYKATELVAALPTGTSLVRVGYADRVPRITGMGEDAARDILSQKKASWAYEREWRVLGPTGRVDLADRCVTHVYLGAAISDENRRVILRRFAGSGISVSEMEVVGYTHRWNTLIDRDQ